MSKIIVITIIIVILAGESLLLFRSGFGKKEVLSTPDALVENIEEEAQIPSTPYPTPIPTKLDYTIDLNKELDSVNPEVLDGDFDSLNILLTSF